MHEVTYNNVPQAIGVLLEEMKIVKKANQEFFKILKSSNTFERLTVEQVVKEYKISKGTFYNLIKQKAFSVTKIGRKTLVKRVDIEEYFDSQSKNLA